MELRHLRYFVAVAEELHFGRAAQRLFMAQPPLSQQIRQLEQEIGVTLLARTNRRVQLTEAGQVFLEEAHTILERVDEAVRRAQRVSRGEAGWLGVGFVGSATYGVLPSILRRFREQHADVELVLLELLGGEQAEALRDRRIHVGFARLPTQSPGIARETVVREPLVMALPSSHRLAAREEIRFAELEAEPFILYPPRSSYADYVLRLCEAAGFLPRVVQETGEMQTAVSLVAANVGVTLVPSAVQSLRREGVVYRPIVEPAPGIDLTMAYRERDTSPVLPRFLELAREIAQRSEAVNASLSAGEEPSTS